MKYCSTTKDRCFHCCDGECQFRYEFITPPEREAIITDAVKVFGVENQTDMAIEEMSELTKALLKFRRQGNLKNLVDIQEKIVDVQIMLDQLKGFYRWAGEMEQKKLIRLRGLVADEEARRSNGQSDDAASQAERG